LTGDLVLLTKAPKQRCIADDGDKRAVSGFCIDDSNFPEFAHRRCDDAPNATTNTDGAAGLFEAAAAGHSRTIPNEQIKRRFMCPLQMPCCDRSIVAGFASGTI